MRHLKIKHCMRDIVCIVGAFIIVVNASKVEFYGIFGKGRQRRVTTTSSAAEFSFEVH